MKLYNVSWEINVEADSPLEAAKICEELMREKGWHFYIQEENASPIFSVDLSAEDDEAVLEIKTEEYSPIIEK